MANDMIEDEVGDVFHGVCMALMSDDGRLKRIHDSTVALEVCARQYDADIRVVKGSRNFSTPQRAKLEVLFAQLWHDPSCLLAAHVVLPVLCCVR